MRTRSRLLLTALTLAIVLATLTSSAFANRALQYRPAGPITSTAPVTFTGPAGSRAITSLVTLRGSLHTAAINKTRGALIGYITECRAMLGELGGLRVIDIRCELTLPWHVQYESFSGTLPRITGVTLRFVRIGVFVRDLIGGGVINCLYEGIQRAIAEIDPRGGTPGVITQIELVSEELPTATRNTTCEVRGTPTIALAGTFGLNTAQTLRLLS